MKNEICSYTDESTLNHEMYLLPNEADIQKLNSEFFQLPEEIQKKAVFCGKSVESGWKPEDVKDVIRAAESSNLANLGGQLQFQTPFGICEPYWVCFDSAERNPGEEWDVYVKRTSEEVLRKFKDVHFKTDYIAEAKAWPKLKAQIEDNGWDPIPSIIFILYFESEKS